MLSDYWEIGILHVIILDTTVLLDLNLSQVLTRKFDTNLRKPSSRRGSINLTLKMAASLNIVLMSIEDDSEKLFRCISALLYGLGDFSARSLIGGWALADDAEIAV
jgi:hypothetical protein